MSDYLKKIKSYQSYVSRDKVYIELEIKKGFKNKPVKTSTGLELAALAATQLVNPKSWSFWDKVELLEDNSPGMVQEAFLQGCKYTMFPSVTYAFGSDAPPSSRFLLHYGKNWKSNLKKSGKLPVLLVPGAGDHAHRAYADPSYGLPGFNQNTGIAQYLDEVGYPVFAITFAHHQGCNFIQSEQISNAVKRIRSVCNVNKVDVIAHSKGNVPVRMYISNIKSIYKVPLMFSDVRKVEVDGTKEIEKYVDVVFPSKRWMTDFAYDIRRYIQLAAPNKGIDAVFRTFSSSAGAYLSKQAPIPFVRYIVGEKKKEIHESMKEAIYYKHNDPSKNNYFPGQCQLLNSLTDDVPLQKTVFKLSAIEKMYYGGHSKIGDSWGIEYAKAQGGMLIDFLREKGTPSYVEVATALGTKKMVNVTFAGLPIPIMYEGVESDGLLFHCSSSDTTGIRNSMGVYDFNLNHLELTYKNEICEWIDEILSHK